MSNLIYYFAHSRGLDVSILSEKKGNDAFKDNKAGKEKGKEGKPDNSRAAAKEARLKARGAKETDASAATEKVNVSDIESAAFGDLPLVQSQFVTGRKFTSVIDLNASFVGQTVWIRARLHSSRSKGKSCFLVLRQQLSTVQAAMFVGERDVTKEMVKFAASINKESIVDLQALVCAAKVDSTSQKDVELGVLKVFCVSSSTPQLPFQIEDASRPEIEGAEEDESRPRVNQDTKLDYRWIDLRTPANQAIFRLQSAVGLLFREYLYSQGFIEIHSPKLIAGTSEGGANVFKLR